MTIELNTSQNRAEQNTLHCIDSESHMADVKQITLLFRRFTLGFMHQKTKMDEENITTTISD